jgi:hypothetical protein
MNLKAIIGLARSNAWPYFYHDATTGWPVFGFCPLRQTIIAQTSTTLPYYLKPIAK